MNEVTAKHGQSLFDLALACGGTVEAAFAMAAMNGIAVTGHIAAGASLACVPVESRKVVSFYEKNALAPATDTDITYGQPMRSWANTGGWGNQRIW